LTMASFLQLIGATAKRSTPGGHLRIASRALPVLAESLALSLGLLRAAPAAADTLPAGVAGTQPTQPVVLQLTGMR
jgi:hypothetical protein